MATMSFEQCLCLFVNGYFSAFGPTNVLTITVITITSQLLRHVGNALDKVIRFLTF